MICSPVRVIQTSLNASIIGSLTLAILAFLHGWIFSGMCFLLFFLPTTMYAYFSWHRISFAACNLKVGLSAVRTNMGVILISFGLVLLGMVYTLFWVLALVGVYDKSADCDEKDCDERPDLIAIIIVFLAYFWTQQVLQNTVNLIVSGTVGKWWFHPEESSSVCSTGLQGSFLHAITYSLGSTCFGSLLTAVVGAVHQLAELSRQNVDDGNCLVRCMCKCCLSIIDYMYTYFNKWAFV